MLGSRQPSAGSGKKLRCHRVAGVIAQTLQIDQLPARADVVARRLQRTEHFAGHVLPKPPIRFPLVFIEALIASALLRKVFMRDLIVHSTSSGSRPSTAGRRIKSALIVSGANTRWHTARPAARGTAPANAARGGVRLPGLCSGAH